MLPVEILPTRTSWALGIPLEVGTSAWLPSCPDHIWGRFPGSFPASCLRNLRPIPSFGGHRMAPSSQLGLMVAPRPGKWGLNSPGGSGRLCVELESIFRWSLICPCCSGLQGMEDHFLVYTFVTWLQGGKRATDWRAPGQTQLLSGSLSHGESRNVQGDFLPFVHMGIWQGASDQGWDEKMRLKMSACFWLFPAISPGKWRQARELQGYPGLKTRWSQQNWAWWVGTVRKWRGWLYLLFPSGTVQKFWCCWWELRSEAQNPS